MEPSILIIDDHEIVREGVRSLLTKHRPDWKIVGEASSGIEAVEAISQLNPDVAILDITMPGMSGFDVGVKLRRLGVSTRILFFTMHDSKSLSTDVRRAGGRGYVLKSEAARKLIQAIETIHGGGTFFGSLQSDIKDSDTPGLGILFLRMGFSPC
jgi:two-component system nitrate/nitrite response regulator NarL